MVNVIAVTTIVDMNPRKNESRYFFIVDTVGSLMMANVEASLSTAGLALDVVILVRPAFDATACWLSILRLQMGWHHILEYKV